MKLTVSRSKNSASFYVQKSIRKENGSVTTVTVEKLGNLDEVRTKANGKDPYVWDVITFCSMAIAGAIPLM